MSLRSETLIKVCRQTGVSQTGRSAWRMKILEQQNHQR